jgi:chromosome segregation ATPase
MTTTGEQHKPSVDELQADIERNREELAETVEALTAKLDVKGRARARLADTRQRAADRLGAGRARANELTRSARSAATTDEGRPTPVALGVAAGVGAALAALGVLVWRRRR